SPRRVGTADNAGPGPPTPVWRACVGAVALTGSSGPGELGGRQASLAFVGDAKGVDTRSLGLGHGQVRADGVEHPVEADRPAGFDPEGHDVFDLEVDRVADADAVPQPVVYDLDGDPFDAEHLTHQRAEGRHGPAQLPTEDLDQLIELLV